MKTYKFGISLIVLVITVIVLAILATTVIISLSNTNIIQKANDAVNEYNKKQYENQMNLAYSSWLADNKTATLTNVSELEAYGFNVDNLPANLKVNVKDGKPEIVTADVWDGETIANSFAGGTGTSGDPYLISTAAELAYLEQIVNNGTAESWKYYKLTSNIDLANEPWTPIGMGSNLFRGTFDGNNYTIYNLNINIPNGNAAFFENLGEYNGASCGLLNLTISGGSVTGENAACFAYIANEASVQNCHNVGVTVTATNYAAGILHEGIFSGASKCTNSGTILGAEAGGIYCGPSSTVTLQDCTNYGTVTATTYGAAGIFCDVVSNASSSVHGMYGSNNYNYGAVHGVTFAAGILACSSESIKSVTFYDINYNYGDVTVDEDGVIYTYGEAIT